MRDDVTNISERFGAEEAHWAHNPRVGGSKLPIATKICFCFGVTSYALPPTTKAV
jgi:hypothetical protein